MAAYIAVLGVNIAVFSHIWLDVAVFVYIWLNPMQSEFEKLFKDTLDCLAMVTAH